MSLKSQQHGQRFEDVLKASFKPYYELGIATLKMMPLPTEAVGTNRGRLLRVTIGKGPFDIYGYRMRDGVFIGAEAKSSGRRPSLPIVGPDKKGDGLQYHQLLALANVAKAGGVARIAWENGGEYGVLSNEHILTAFDVYSQAMTSEARGKDVRTGAKSIRWELFEVVDYTTAKQKVFLDWLKF
jgi:penicillin-binding protein-related factor A (putative recombinase)